MPTGLAGEYLDLLLRGRHQAASELVLTAAEAGTSIRGIYLRVFQPVMYEIGRLWETNKISVAQEHYCTAATQVVMARLYPRVFTGDRKDRRLVAACVGGELHELGIRMVAHFFEMEGWDTCYLGANTPASGLLQTLQALKADLLAVSGTMPFHLTAVAALIAEVRASAFGRTLPIMVGGRPFNTIPELWKKVGADGSAPDAEQALKAANGLVGPRSGPLEADDACCEA